MKVNLQGLRQQLRKFDENGHLVRGYNWAIGRGCYHCNFVIYYKWVPVVECIANELVRVADCENYEAIAKIVLQEYPDLKKYNK